MFQNAQINTGEIPQYQSILWEKLNKKYLTASLLSSMVFFLIPWFMFGGNSILRIEELPSFLLYGVPVFLICLMLLVFVLVRLGFHRKAYALRERDVYFKEGLFWKSITSIPFNRVQHVEVKQGPIDRYFGLAKLIIYTAGGSASDLSIPGLELDQAQNVKAFILNKTTIEDEEE